MYESFFGFKDKPFSLLPDPGLFYPSQIHREALTLLEYGLYNQAGFTVITGEIGSGKTTLMRYLLERLERDMTVGLISHTHQSLEPIMDWICAAFDIQAPRDDRIAQHQAFVDFLLAEYARGRKALLIIDEAQNLDRDTLEEIRLLSNVNSEHDILLQLLLLGQPELREQLRQPGLEQFIQRISASYHLGRLSQDDSCRYIRHRLRSAGGRPDIFTPEACHAIFHYSQGIPRLINLICDTALVFAYGAGESRIDGHAIDTFVHSDGSHLLFAIDGEQIAPLPEYQPILPEELDAELQALATSRQTQHAAHDAPTEPQPVADATENIAPRLHTPTAPPNPGATLNVDYAGWSAGERVAGFERAGLNEAARSHRRWGWEITAVATGVLTGIALVGWYLREPDLDLPSGPNEHEILGSAIPDASDVADRPSTPPTLQQPFDVLISLAQEPSGPDAAGPAVDEAPVVEAAPQTAPSDNRQETALERREIAPELEPAAPDSATLAPEASAGPVADDRGLDWLASRLTASSIPVERIAPNHVRADLSRLIQFRDGSVALDEQARAALARLADLLKQDERLHIHVVTHTDSQGSAANNQLLSERRAADIALILRLAGIADSRLTHEGKGLSEPKFTREEEQRLGYWINRRVEIDLIETDAAR